MVGDPAANSQTMDFWVDCIKGAAEVLAAIVRFFWPLALAVLALEAGLRILGIFPY